MNRFFEYRRPGLACALFLAVSALCVTGCGESDREKAARLAAAMDQAITLLDEAHQGFVQPAAARDTDRHRADAIQDNYIKAIDQLGPVLREGQRTQQHGAAQLLAQLHVARAAHITRRAAGRWAAMANQAATVMTHLAAVQRADALASALTGDEASLQGEMAGVRKQLDFQLQTLDERLTELRRQIDANQGQADDLMAQRNGLMGRVADLEQQAFTADKDAGYELKLQAIELRRQADQLIGKLERLSVQRTGLDSEHAIVAAQIEHLRALAADVSDEIERSGQRDQAIVAAHEQALDVKQQAVDSLVAAFTQVAQAFNDEVASRFDDALAEAQAGVDAASTAVRSAEMRTRQDARLGLLSAQTAAAGVRTRYVLALGGFGQTVAVITRQAADAAGSQGGFFTENLQRLAAKQSELIAAAADDITTALELAGQLGAADDPDSEAADQTTRLQTYLTQLEDARIAG